MNQLQVFNYEANEVRTVIINGQPWWIAKDICSILGQSNTTVALERLDADEVTKFNLGGLAGEANLVNEAGMYSLILGSRKPEAKAFKRWITHEVIPSIRKHGLYAKDELLDNPDLLLEVVTKLKAEREMRLEAESERNVLIEVVDYKNEVIVGLVDTVDVYTKRTVLNRVVRHKGANFQHRYRELYKVFREMNSIDLQARCEGYNAKQLKKKDKLSVMKYAEQFGHLDGLYKAAVKLYETDVEEIIASIRQ